MGEELAICGVQPRHPRPMISAASELTKPLSFIKWRPRVVPLALTPSGVQQRGGSPAGTYSHVPGIIQRRRINAHATPKNCSAVPPSLNVAGREVVSIN